MGSNVCRCAKHPSILCLIIVAMAQGCWVSRDMGGSGAGPAQSSSAPSGPPVTSLAEELTVPADFAGRAQSPQFQEGLRAFSSASGLQFAPSTELPGAYMATAPYEKAEANLVQWHQAAEKSGVFLIRNGVSFGIGSSPDTLLALPCTDKFEVLQIFGTDGINYDLDNAKVIAWLREMDRENPFVLTGAGLDYLEGYFVAAPKDTQALAQRMYEFCPDIVDQGVGDVDALAEELATGKLYFWWD